MTRLDLHWDTGVEVREAVWRWRHDIAAQVVNPDVDGLLTACLLHHLKGWPVVGFYDTQRLLVDSTHPLPLDLQRTVWVDVDMCWPGARSLSQHVVMDRPSDGRDVSAYQETVNPSLLRGHARRHDYRNKYPFGTFQWTWWLANRGYVPATEDEIRTGLAWMPDGGFQSVEGVWRENCLQWATEQMRGSILEPLAREDPSRARRAVVLAENELRRISGVNDGWSNHQFSLTRGSATGPVLNFRLDEVADVLQAVCDAICEVYGWRRLPLPAFLDVHHGAWRLGARPPTGWPGAANKRVVVSLAVTSGQRFCWTEPGDLSAVLGGNVEALSRPAHHS